MADVLDAELQAISGLTGSMATLAADMQTLIADFTANPPQGILTSDPRWQTLTDGFTALSQNVSDLDSKVKAALPPSP